METLRKLVLLTLVFTLTTATIQGQDYEQDDEECGSAYLQSSQTAHWSVWIPITVLIVAAIWFGVSDQNHHRTDSSDSQDALGSIDNSKRQPSSSSSYRSNNRHYRHHGHHNRQLRGGYSHH